MRGYSDLDARGRALSLPVLTWPRRRKLWRFLLFCTSICGCADGNSERQVPTTRVQARPILTDKKALDAPWDVVVSPKGVAFVLDFGNRQVDRLDPRTGQLAAHFGRPGAGPGEFELPLAMGLVADTLMIVDAGNRRLTSYSVDGSYLGDRPLHSIPTGRTTIGVDGSLAVELRGAGGFLVGVLDRRDVYRRVGALSGLEGPWNFTAIRAEARAGRIHPITRSQVIGVAGADGVVWVIKQTENLILQFDRDGKEVSRTNLLSHEEWEAVLRDYIEANTAETRPDVIHPLVPAVDAKVIGSSLFVLLGPTVGPGATLIEFDSTGQRRRKLIVEGADQPFRFWLDPTRKQLLISSVAEASIYTAAIPALK